MTNNKKQKENALSFLPRARCTEQERRAVMEKARLAGVSCAEFQRRACLDAVIVVRENLIDQIVAEQLMKIGNNLNQLTRLAHIHDEVNAKKLMHVLGIVEKTTLELMGHDGS